MIEVVEGFIRAKGKSHGIGKSLSLSANDEERLVSLGVAKYVDKKTKGNSDSNKNTDSDKKADSNQEGTDDQKQGQDDGEGPNTQLPLE